MAYSWNNVRTSSARFEYHGRMSLRWSHLLVLLAALTLPGTRLCAQSSSSSRHHTDKSVAEKPLDSGSVNDGIYRNKTLGLTCKIPDEWVLRTDEMNGHGDGLPDATAKSAVADASQPAQAPSSDSGGKVLLAAFSRPPEAKGEEVNSSILIAAEPVTAYPGLKDPVQYFGPLSEVAQAQGLQKDEDPYEVAIGPQTLVRGDFHKDVGTRVMRQSTLVMLSHGYAVSITVIAGSDDGIEELVNGLDFQRPRRSTK